jgi:hypothetical protein
MRSDRSEKGKRDGSLRMPKNRIGQTMKDAMQVKKGSTNRSSDLSFLSSQFDVVKIKLSQLIDALKGHYKSLLQINKTRLLVSLTLYVMNRYAIVCAMSSHNRPKCKSIVSSPENLLQ